MNEPDPVPKKPARLRLPERHFRLTEVDPARLSLESQREIAKFLRERDDPSPRGLCSKAEGRTLRLIANQWHVRPPRETFHEFLIDNLKMVLGQEWWEQQLKKKKSLHVLIHWIHQWCQMTREAMPPDHVAGDVYSAQPTGGPLAILTIADDIYRLSLKRRLPTGLISRLKVRGLFQGVRYEMAVAAIMVRAGWAIDWVDESKVPGGCEVIATYDKDHAFAVEAKSRHRPGVLHLAGQPPTTWPPDVEDLLTQARKKTTGDRPLVVFLDVNVPHEPFKKPDAKSWVVEARRLLSQRSNPPREELLVLTNFAWHLDGENLALKGEFVVDPLGATTLDPRAIAEIRDRLDRYGDVPLDD